MGQIRGSLFKRICSGSHPPPPKLRHKSDSLQSHNGLRKAPQELEGLLLTHSPPTPFSCSEISPGRSVISLDFCCSTWSISCPWCKKNSDMSSLPHHGNTVEEEVEVLPPPAMVFPAQMSSASFFNSHSLHLCRDPSWIWVQSNMQFALRKCKTRTGQFIKTILHIRGYHSIGRKYCAGSSLIRYLFCL